MGNGMGNGLGNASATRYDRLRIGQAHPTPDQPDRRFTKFLLSGGSLFSYGAEAEKTFVRSAVSTPPSSTGLPAVEPCVEVQNGLNAVPTDPSPS